MTAFIYPAEFLDNYAQEGANYPLQSDICLQEVDGAGMAVIAQRPFARGEIIGSFTGPVMPNIAQHTLQIDPQHHLLDPYFIGYLMHSCDPNVVLDMHQRLAYCIKDTAEGEPLCMDYASTEDVLFKQFPCCCGAPNCREWVSGRAETLNEEGRMHLLRLKGNTGFHALQMLHSGAH